MPARHHVNAQDLAALALRDGADHGAALSVLVVQKLVLVFTVGRHGVVPEDVVLRREDFGVRQRTLQLQQRDAYVATCIHRREREIIDLISGHL